MFFKVQPKKIYAWQRNATHTARYGPYAGSMRTQAPAARARDLVEGADMGACCGRPSNAACSQLAAAGLLLSAADWALLRGRGVTGAAAVLALGDEGLWYARALQLRSDPSCFYSASWRLPSADIRFARPVIY